MFSTTKVGLSNKKHRLFLHISLNVKRSENIGFFDLTQDCNFLMNFDYVWDLSCFIAVQEKNVLC